MIDFYQYSKLYRDMDYTAVDSPLNMRLLSSGCVYLMSKLGYFYETHTAIDGSSIDKLYYFNAILFNYGCVVATCSVIFCIVRERGRGVLFSFVAGMLYLFGFGTIFFELVPLSDALAVLLFSIFLLFYYRRSYWMWVPLLLLIIQREYLLMVVIVIAIIDSLKARNRYYVITASISVFFFIIHVALRKMVFETPHYSHHTSLTYMLDSLTTLRFPVKPLIRQTFATMNICLLYFGLVIYKKYKRMPVSGINFLKILLLLVQVIVLAFLLALGNNAGRYFYMVTPLIIVYLMNEVQDFKLISIYSETANEPGR
jgi:hypothetical protein